MVLATEVTFLDVPFAQKDEAKALGARFDGQKRKWYVDVGTDLDNFARWLGDTRTYLACPFDEKDAAKALGARWDNDARKWFVGRGTDLAPFAKWLPRAGAAPSTPERRPAAAEPVTGDKRAREPTHSTGETFMCPIHHVALRGPITVRNGQPHNMGRQFFKCPQADDGDGGEKCGLRGGFKWADGTAPFSAESCRRAETHHGLPDDSIGVGVSGAWVADELVDGVPVNPKPHSGGPGPGQAPKRHRLDDELDAAAAEDDDDTEEEGGEEAE